MSESSFAQTVFRINSQDNVATALCEIQPGAVRVTGEAVGLTDLEVLEQIPDGHKVAVCKIAAGEQILKYGISIGTATCNIQKGQWVHLHCMCSNYDERSSHLDLHTGVPTDSEYE